MKTLLLTLIRIALVLGTANAQHPVKHLVIWVDDVENNHENPPAPQGFYHDPQWFPEGSMCPYPNIGEIGNEYGCLYTADNVQTPDPNEGVHLVEYQPDCVHDEDCTGGKHLFWNNNQTEYHYLFGSPAVWIEHDEESMHWCTDRVYGGLNQAYNPTVPPQYQPYEYGTVWVYENPNWGDFAEWWYRYHPAYDFNKDRFVNIEDLIIFITEVLHKQ
jgi:hypothetical protein